MPEQIPHLTGPLCEENHAQEIVAFRHSLLRYCEFLSGSIADAEDLVQSTFLKVFPLLNGGPSHANLHALLRRIAKNTWIDVVRKRKLYDVVSPEELSMLADPVTTHDSLLVKEALGLLIQVLTPQQRAVVLLCDVFQYTNREASDLLGMSLGALKATLHRARAQLLARRVDFETRAVVEDEQVNILEAYVAAFHDGNIHALVQLCRDGMIDPVEATTQVLTGSQKHNRTRMQRDISFRAYLRVA